jgi:colanic acid biosynthesis protein WcaH
MTKLLPKNKFIQLVKNGPLIAMDILILDKTNKILLGYRTNNPAINSWFVPGGCIRKNESFKIAHERITLAELGVKCNISKSKFLGVYEHFYSNNFNDNKFGTHYVVHAYKIKLNISLNDLPKEQHKKYKWFTKEEVLINKNVHKNTKNYIKISL